MRYLYLITFLVFWSSQVFGRGLTICVVDSLEEPIKDATAFVSTNDSIIGMGTSDNYGKINFLIPDTKLLNVQIEAAGFHGKALEITADVQEVRVIMEYNTETINLNEITVVSDRSSMVKRIANGNRFYLSQQAKKMNDPFMALKEIPSITSDPFNSTVTTLNGASPLILVNGIELNSGIKPISPADIEYVEVIDAVPARFLAKGVSAIINIQLRKNRPPYVWTELATRHEVPLHKGFGVWYFEVGNEKLSLFGRASVEYLHHDDKDGQTEQSNISYNQKYDWGTRTNGHNAFGELILKYVPTQRDYFAVEIYEKYSKSFTGNQREGEYTSIQPMVYHMKADDSNRSSVFTSSAYYKHEFDWSTQLEIIAAYNYNWNKMSANAMESFGSKVNFDEYNYDNCRNSGHLSIDFSKTFNNGNYLQAGSYTSLLNDRIEMSTQPIFHHSNYDEYIYTGYGGSWRKLYYILSAGIQATWLKAGEYSNNYIRPRATVSGTWQFNNSNSVQVYYTTNNSAPEAGKLNPYVISTDSLFVTRGNPMLVPQTFHSVKMTYEFNLRGFYAGVAAGANFFRDVIVPGGYSSPDGIYFNTYVNQGRYHNYTADMNLSYRLVVGNLNGRIYGGINYIRRCYTDISPLGSFSYSGGFAAWFHKFYFGGDVSFSPRNYTDITTTKNLRPLMANIQVNYNITPNFYVALCLQGFAGNNQTIVRTENGTFKSETYTNFRDTGLCPWILLRWNMRKNVKRKINLDNVLQSKENGINLK